MTILSNIQWCFTDECFTDEAKFNEAINQDGWDPHEIIHNFPEFNFIYFAWIFSKHEILPNEIKKAKKYGRHEVHAKLLANNGKFFTSLELLMKIHNQMSNKFLGDHFFFEGIDLTRDIIDGTEPFIIYCGS